jgi:hypothetical protein
MRPTIAGLGPRVRDWLLRYGPAELAGMLLGLAALLATRRATQNAVAGAYAAAWGETIGYAGVIAVRDFVSESRDAHRQREGAPNRALQTRTVGLRLLAEFGPAGIIDTLISRPFAMAVGVRFCGPVLGVVVGKIFADALFYTGVIYMYERGRRARAN